MTLTESLTDAGFGLGWSVAKAMPEGMVDGLFRAAADRAWRRQGPGVRQLRANLSRVLDDDRIVDLDEIAHEGMRRYMRYWCEAFLLPSWNDARVTASFRLGEGLDLLDAAVASGKGAIMVSPHSGNWDLAAAWASHRYGGIVTVAERLKPEGLYDRFVAYRESLGMEVFPLGDPSVLRQLARRLREGKLVCLLADRDISGTGVDVDFFGEPASMPAGPAVLSLLTGAPIMPVTLWHVADGVDGRVGTALAIPSEGDRAARIQVITQTIADVFARDIHAHPEDWHMMQPLWAADLEQYA
ncbi:MAG: phosphatidylinositol mannoside acyltransferase [Candidatus Nanopelagicales bacterium]